MILQQCLNSKSVAKLSHLRCCGNAIACTAIKSTGSPDYCIPCPFIMPLTKDRAEIQGSNQIPQIVFHPMLYLLGFANRTPLLLTTDMTKSSRFLVGMFCCSFFQNEISFFQQKTKLFPYPLLLICSTVSHFEQHVPMCFKMCFFRLAP